MPAKKALAKKKPAVKKAAVKKPAMKKTVAKKVVRKTVVKKAPVRKVTARSSKKSSSCLITGLGAKFLCSWSRNCPVCLWSRTFLSHLKAVLKGEGDNKKILSIWVTVSVVASFAFWLWHFIVEYNMRPYQETYRVLWNTLYSGVLTALALFIPVFFAVMIYCIVMRMKRKEINLPFFTDTFKTKIKISALVALVFTVIVYLDASNIVPSESVYNISYCAGKAANELCMMSWSLFFFMFNIFVSVFLATLFVSIALFGFYRGVSPTFYVSQKGKRKK